MSHSDDSINPLSIFQHGNASQFNKEAKDLKQMARDFFKLEAAGGLLLMITAVMAMVLANTPLNPWYDYLFNAVSFQIGFGEYKGEGFILIEKPLLLWINDGLMAIFFFLVGLEIKREVMEGELSSRERALLPFLAAVGGMVVPAGIYWFLNQHTPETLSGWAIPAATDIAFALGVMALLGSRVPLSLKVLLTAIAVIDDLGAILIIAFFYTEGVAVGPLYFALAALLALVILNNRQVTSKAPYVILGIILWIAVLKSGLHATLAGVVTALFIPLHDKKDLNHSPCKHLEHSLHPWVAFMILPMFAFANAGVSFQGLSFDIVMEPVTMGIAMGLFFGKQFGIFGMIWLTIRLGLSPMPRRASWMQLYAVSILCGIGFTMSLFIGALAFEDPAMQASIRLGVIMGSIFSAIIGYLLLRYCPTANANARLKSIHEESLQGRELET